MRTLLVAAAAAGRLDPQTASALTAALRLGGEVDVLVAGAVVSAIAIEAARLEGVSRVLVADSLGLAHGSAAYLATLIVSLAGRYEAIVAPSTSAGRAVMPRVAALLDVMQVSEVVDVLGPDTFRRPIYAGSAIETVRSADRKLGLTVRPSAFPPAASGGSAPMSRVPIPPDPQLGRVVSESAGQGDRPDLGAARIVVSGGRGLGSKENFEALIVPLARRLGAAIGASRAAV
ncbi:MAG: electron transfer flavoprotein subunit alpha/FixB family protein, partial [Devosia sp.]